MNAVGGFMGDGGERVVLETLLLECGLVAFCGCEPRQAVCFVVKSGHLGVLGVVGGGGQPSTQLKRRRARRWRWGWWRVLGGLIV